MKTKHTEKPAITDPCKIFDYMGKDHAPRETVTLPSGQTCLVRGLTCQEYGTLQEEIREDGDVDFNAAAPLYLVYGALKPDGSQAFSTEDIDKIMDTPRALIQPMVDKIIDLTGVSPDANEQLTKNWGALTVNGLLDGSPTKGLDPGMTGAIS